MKTIVSSPALTLFLGCSALTSSNGFTVPTTRAQITSRNTAGAITTKTTTSLQLSEEDDSDVEKMLAMAKQLREEANVALVELGKEAESRPVKVVDPATIPLSSAEASELLQPLNFEGGATAEEQSTALAEIDRFTKWNQCTGRKIRTYAVTQDGLKQKTSGKVTGDSLGVFGDPDVSLDDIKDLTVIVLVVSSILAVASLVFLPENIGATFTYLFGGIPIVFVAVGSTSPGLIADALASTKKTRDDDVEKSARICVHEAGHFLCGYLCGLPVKSYEITAEDVPCVEFHVTGSGDLAREYTNEEIAALSVVAMSGSVAEVIEFEQAKGGANDLVALDGCFRRSKEFLGAAKQDDLTRWGALLSYQLLTENKEIFAKLVQAFKRKDSIKDCIAIIESRS
mmetsp:Transcript_47991/g.57863  ORF Transcript_47991/g.57863 Transcript_47991/m.57863 type:complete len:398 (+) Transcript_47991:73-1266(+)